VRRPAAILLRGIACPRTFYRELVKKSFEIVLDGTVEDAVLQSV
jgi:hypothetical protein